MAGIYAADIYCDACIEDIKRRVISADSGTPVDDLPDDLSELEEKYGYEDERDYDSGEYPKYASDDAESDSPTHCGSHDDCLNAEVLNDDTEVGYCFGNALTSVGEEYVRQAVREGGACAELWRETYSWIDFPSECEHCGAIASDDLCESCEESKCIDCGDITNLDDEGYCSDCAPEQPCEGDFTITPCGRLGGKSGLGRVEGKFIGEFDSDDDAIAAARALMEAEQFWPNIWLVSDHGNWELLAK